MTRMLVKLLIVLGMAAFFAPSPAAAQSCSFSATDVAFGPVDTLSGLAVDSSGSVDINCSGSMAGTDVRICLNINAGSGGRQGANRRMGTGPNRLLYQFFQDPARTVLWGSVTTTQLGQPLALTLTLPAGGGAVMASATLYGRVNPNQQITRVGAYSSSFSGTHTRFNYRFFTGATPACSTVTQNPTQVPFNATATVAANCLLSSQNLNFGTRGVLDTNTDVDGQVTARCTPQTPYAITLDGGTGDHPPAARRMTQGAEFVTYGLYRNTARTQVWAETAATDQNGTGNGNLQNYAVRGRVFVQTTPSPGVYADTVVATITY